MIGRGADPWLVELLDLLVDAVVEGFVVGQTVGGRLPLGIEHAPRQDFFAVEELDAIVEVFADGDAAPAQGIAWGASAGLDDVALAGELGNEVLGELARVLQRADAAQLFVRSSPRAVGVAGLSRGYGEAGVVLLQIRPEEGVGGADIRDPCEAQGLDQAVLQGLEQAFDPALGLRARGLDGGDLELVQGAFELRRGEVLGIVLGEDRVAIAVQGRRAALTGDCLGEQAQIGSARSTRPSRSARRGPRRWRRR
jgi:hypothetical protein